VFSSHTRQVFPVGGLNVQSHKDDEVSVCTAFLLIHIHRQVTFAPNCIHTQFKYIYIYIYIFIYLFTFIFIFGFYLIFFVVHKTVVGPRPPHLSGFEMTHTHRHTTLSKTPPDEGSAFLRDLYLITLNIPNRQTNMSPAGFEPAISNKQAAVTTRTTGLVPFG